MKQGKVPRVNAVDRGLQILEWLAEQGEASNTSEIGRRLKIPKSTTSYLLHTMHSRGYLHREPNGSYRLSLKLLAVGSRALHRVEVREAGAQILRRVVQETGITGHLAILEGTEAVYIERVPSPGFVQMDTWVGRRMPLHSTSAGKVLLAFLPGEDAETLLRSSELRRSTPKTIVSLVRLKQEMRKVRDQGFAVDDEENTAGVRCVAAPIFDRDGKVVAAVSLTGTIHQVTEELALKVAEKVKEAARQISHALGGKVPSSAPKPG